MLSTFIDGSPEFGQALAKLQARGDSDLGRVEGVVREVIDAVRAGGDEAVLSYVERFEHRTPRSLVLRDFDGEGALGRLPAEARAALELAADRIRRFHEREREPGFSYSEGGVTLGLRVRPLGRVGVYAPGGKARYPSSVLMSAVPAKVAGVTDVVLATPLAGDASDDALLAAAYLSGITTILDAGGAQAIAAMAYGTASLPRVDKIVGPGNLYVACAKRMVYGAVAIDSIAGPSEILVVADESANARHVAADLLSQAEHDEDAYPLLLCTSESFARAVGAEVERQLSSLPREGTARVAVERQGAALVVSGRDRLAQVATAIAAEHLSLQVDQAEALLEHIGCAGAAFLGGLTPEAAGDYVAGPSHVLPTGGAVRFGSPLGVYDFVTRTSVLRYSAEALEGQEGAICALARLEGLEAHARAVEVRVRERE
jgi:histidinol dehydrogenase